MRRLFGGGVAALGLVTGCGGEAAPAPAPNYEPVPVAGSRCDAVVQAHPIEGQLHREECSPLSFRSNPPSSGDHYRYWPVFTAYEQPLPRGYWVHALEHGAVVLTYHCAEGCPEEERAARELFAALSPEPFCLKQGATAPRAVLTPDPLLDVRWAASAWGYTLRADCFEPEVFDAFYTQRVGRGPEAVCAEGVELRDGGVLELPPGCGEERDDG